LKQRKIETIKPGDKQELTIVAYNLASAILTVIPPGPRRVRAGSCDGSVKCARTP
jgi:hypothetical protein